MRKIKLQMQVSIDGYVAGPNGEMDWMTWDMDDELKKYIMDLTDPVDCIIMGRNLASGFIPHWDAYAKNPETTDVFSKKMVDTHKVVFSKTMEENPWENTVIANGDLTEEVAKLKNEEGGDIIVYGGAQFVSELIATGLIDELHLFVNPAALGSGMSIFKERTPLQLLKSTEFSCGIVVSCYKHA